MKMTKKQRYEQKVAEGMSHLDAEIAAQKEENEEKLQRLLAKQKREEAKVREKQPEWLRINHPDLWQQSVEEIRAEMRSPRTRRSSAASQNDSVTEEVTEESFGDAEQSAPDQEAQRFA